MACFGGGLRFPYTSSLEMQLSRLSISN